jgi:hypothetical protein
VSDTAVRKAIKVGRIATEADGTIDSAKADAQWASNTDPALQRKPEVESIKPTRAAPATSSTARVSTGSSPLSAPASGATAAATAGLPNAGGTSLLQARTANEVLKAQTNKVRLARMKGELIERHQAIAHVFKLARSERDAWLNWPARVSAQMAAHLNVEPHALHVALENAVREHLAELGDPQIRID